MSETLIDRYYRARTARHLWPDEVARRAEGAQLKITRDFFFHMNPLYEPNLAMQYIVGRYEAAYDALAKLKPRSVLEIGCAQGLSTWLMTSYAERVVGLDISEDRIAVGRTLFPEVEWVTEDFQGYLKRTGAHFDVIINSHGPVHITDDISAACRHYIYIGYRTNRWAEALRGAHKLTGQQLSFSTTLVSPEYAGVSPSYPSYFLRRNWLKEARHALLAGNCLPM